MQNSVDISIAALSKNYQRSLVIAFLPQFSGQYYSIWIKNTVMSSETISWKLFISPLSAQLWLVLAIVALLVTILKFFMDKNMSKVLLIENDDKVYITLLS